MSLSSLIQEGYDLGTDAKNIFSLPLGSTYLYPTDATVVNAINKVKAKNWKYDLGYAFEVEGSDEFSNFILQVNPQEYQEVENFSNSILPTQTGVVVEYQGFVMKALTIRGTTGINPSNGQMTGYEQFMHLRNYFRAFQEKKKYVDSRGLRLIFRNKKDNEHWYVEPIGPGVTLNRSESRPFLYDYVISLLIIGKASERKKATGVFAEVLDTIDQVENFVDDVSDRIQGVATLIHNGFNLLSRTSQQIMMTLVNPIDKVNKVFEAMRYGKNTVSALPKSFYKGLRDSAVQVRDNVSDLFGLGDPTYNATYGRTTLNTSKSFIYSDVKSIEAVNNTIEIMDKILSSNIVFSPEANSGLVVSSSENLDDSMKINTKAVQENRIGSTKSLSDSFGNQLNFNIPSTVNEVKVEYNDTLEKIAYRHMANNAAMWYQIAMLNNLDPPYISNTPIPNKNTVQPGGKLLVPVFSNQDRPNILEKDDTKLTKDLSTFEKNFGVDLLLTKEFDLAYDYTSRDLRLIAGVSNVAQAVIIKLGLEPDSLLYHPELGVNLRVGQVNKPSVEDITNAIDFTITADKRFKAVTSLQVARQNTTIQLKMSVLLNNMNSPVPLQVNLKAPQ